MTAEAPARPQAEAAHAENAEGERLDAEQSPAEELAQPGDDVALWRPGQGGGLVAIGSISEPCATPPGDVAPEGGFGSTPGTGLGESFVVYRQMFLGEPVPRDALRGVGLERVLAKARSRSAGLLLPLSTVQWRKLIGAVRRPRTPAWPAAWNLQPGSVVQRPELIAVFGGNPRTAAAPSARTPNVFLFLDARARSHGHRPRWDGDVLIVPGNVHREGGIDAGNLGVLHHLRRGRPLRVFETRGRECLYVGEFVIDQYRPVEEDAPVGADRAQTAEAEESPARKRIMLFRLTQLFGSPSSFDTSGLDPAAPRVSLNLQASAGGLESGSRSARRRVATRSAHGVRDSERADIEGVRRLARAAERDPEIAQSLAQIDEAQALAAIVQHARRREDIAVLRRIVEDPRSKESDLQQALEAMLWVFGGEFLSARARRSLTTQDQLDLSLIRPDGSLHGVELKLANIPKLVKKHRNHFIVDSPVNEAVGQAGNYLRSLDEQYAHIRLELGIDCRRTSMTVVIGCARFCEATTEARVIAETIRTYNSHLSRIRVVTYDDLLASAEQSLTLVDTPLPPPRRRRARKLPSRPGPPGT
jgi:hypothetical protein